MPRTISEINDEIKANFVANPTIQSLYGIVPGTSFADAFSLVSFEATLFYIIAVSIWTLENNFSLLQDYVDQKVEQAQRWDLRAIENDARAFQYGDPLEFLGVRYGYAVENTANQIVKLASATEVGSSVILKVANQNAAGDIIPLTAAQLTTFNLYIKKLMAPGVDLQVVSRDADDLKIYYKIYFDPLVMNPDGSLIADPTIKPVEIAINEYCKGLDFNGVFNVTRLTDKLQGLTGVETPVFQSAEAKYGLTAYAPVNDFYNPNAGYLKVDVTSPLNTTITYLQA